MKHYITHWNLNNSAILHRKKSAGQVRALAVLAVRYLHEQFRVPFDRPTAQNSFEVQSLNYTHVIM